MNAIISTCGKYRYRLDRKVSGIDGVVAYFGINPSTADASIDDQTVKKWREFTKLNGCGNFIVGNVFAFRSTKVRNLALIDDPTGPKNDRYLEEIILEADILIPCWESRYKIPKALRPDLDLLMTKLLNAGLPVRIFGKTKSGDPKHPMMLGYDTALIEITRGPE